MNHGPPGTQGRRPFWRSRGFWLGVPGLLFLLWGWVYSNRRSSDLSYGPWGLQISSCNGHVVVAKLSPQAAISHRVDRWLGIVYSIRSDRPTNKDKGLVWTAGAAVSCSFGPSPTDLTFDQSEVHPERRSWWPPFQLQKSNEPKSGFWLLALPHWGISLGYLIVWSGALAWRRRTDEGVEVGTGG